MGFQHRQAGTSCDELKDLGGWKSRQMVDRYAKYATEHLALAAARIETPPETPKSPESGPKGSKGKVITFPTFSSRSQMKMA